jgi:hypothetical protein
MFLFWELSAVESNMNKGRWTQDKHKIFMQEYEKYGNNCMQIAKVLSIQTPAQIKKHAECFFKENLKTNSAAVKGYQESLSPDGKAQAWSKMLLNNKTLTISLTGGQSPNFKQGCCCTQETMRVPSSQEKCQTFGYKCCHTQKATRVPFS